MSDDITIQVLRVERAGTASTEAICEFRLALRGGIHVNEKEMCSTKGGGG